MATIKIYRSDEFNNRARNFKIFIDGVQAGTIANGETKEFAVSQGLHIITAKIDWCSSPDVQLMVAENQTAHLEVSGFRYGSLIRILASAIIAIHFILKITLDIEYTAIAIIPFFLIYVYYLTIGRKKYLRLREIQLQQ